VRAQESRFEGLLPLLLVPVALLSDPSAALPLRSYYARDFASVFYPLQAFQARELLAGRLPAWNPYVFEGTFMAPALYPLHLLLALRPGPAFASWLLTLHLPLAALAAYWLARQLNASRGGAFVSGAVYALSGFALSSLALCAPLPALALAPFVAGLLRRAAREGGRSVALAAAAFALALSTGAVETVVLSALLGLGLGTAGEEAREVLPRVAAAVALGAGLAAVPVALGLGVLAETAHVAGAGGAVALAQSLHPAALLQALVPHLFGFPQSSADAFWGARFFGSGLPALLSVYLGPLALGLAVIGLARMERGARLVLVVLAVAGLWYALGASAGLGPVVQGLGALGVFRFPSQALLLPQIAVALAAGFGFGRVASERGALRSLAIVVAVEAALVLGLVALLAAKPEGLVAWSGVAPGEWARVVGVVARDAALGVLLAVAVGGLLFLQARDLVGTGAAAAVVAALVVGDLVRAGIGLNPQADAPLYEPLPEIAALRLSDLAGARVFSYGVDHSPAFRELQVRGGETVGLTSFFLHRQLLGPYANVLDSVEAAEGTDVTTFVPRDRELAADRFDPARAGALVPWLRNAGVARVLSLDPLEDQALVPLGRVDAGPPGIAIHVYGFDSWPRASLACRATPVGTRDKALAFPYRPGFDPWREVALEKQADGEGPDDALAATCTKGRARPTAFVAPTEERYSVETNASAYLVVRASFARGWKAAVDGVPTPVVRANGKHRAIAVSAGKHEVVLRYEPPGLLAGELLSGVALVAWLLLLLVAPRPRW